MVARLPLLIVALLLLAGCVRADRGVSCRECHAGHRPDRGDCVSCHRGNPATSRKELAHEHFVPGRLAAFTRPSSSTVRQGKQVIEQLGCRRCHRIGKEGNDLATNLDEIGGKDPAAVAESITHPVPFMPDFHLDDARLAQAVNAIFAFARANGDTDERPTAVRFAAGSSDKIFSTKCGGCHRMMSPREGALGAGDAGPNLSGLFSPHYPATRSDGKPWTEQRLADWLRNPRSVRSTALMPPLPLKQGDLSQLLDSWKK